MELMVDTKETWSLNYQGFENNELALAFWKLIKKRERW
jgi:hypothetical protein